MHIPTKRQHRAMERATSYEDPIAECIRRWPDFSFEVKHQEHPGSLKLPPFSIRTVVRATWTGSPDIRPLPVSGRAHELIDEAGKPRATDAQIEESKERLARAAIYFDEYRKALDA